MEFSADDHAIEAQYPTPRAVWKREPYWRLIAWVVCGLVLANIMLYMAGLTQPAKQAQSTFTSWFSETGECDPSRPRIYEAWGLQVPSLAMMLYLLAGVVFMLAIAFRPRKGLTPWMAVMLLLVAVVMRAPMFGVEPRGGVDYNRYLWDGAMTANGYDPYRYTPHELLESLKTPVTLSAGWQAKIQASRLPAKAQARIAKQWKGISAGKEVAVDRREAKDLIRIGAVQPCTRTRLDPLDVRLDNIVRRGADTLESCSHQELRTPYPPFAQALFALAYKIAPFDLGAWRTVLAGLDVLAAVAVLLLLRIAKRPKILCMVYLWNPLLVMETYYSAHLEIAVAALVALFAWCLLSGRLLGASVTLAGAVAAKVWPIFLAMFLLRPSQATARRLIISGAVFVIVTAVFMAPYAWTEQGPASGAMQYQRHSHDNYGVHYFLDLLDRDVLKPMGIRVGTDSDTAFERADQGARAVGMILTLLAAAWLGLKKPAAPADVTCLRIGAVMMLMLLLAPTVYPWYYVAIIPLAAVAMRPSLLAWSLLAPLMYFPRALFPQCPGAYEDAPLMLVIHLPVWVLLAIDLWRTRNAPANTPSSTAPPAQGSPK